MWGRIKQRVSRVFGNNDDASPDSKPLIVLEEYNEKLFDNTERLAKRHLELNQVRAKLQRHEEKLEKLLRKYDDQARKHYQRGQEELVEAALKEKLQHKAELIRLQDSILELDKHIIALKSHKERLQGQLQLFQIRKEAIELRYDASKTELETRELQMGMSDDNLPDVQDAIHEAESEIHQIQIQLDATRELERESPTSDTSGVSVPSSATELEAEIDRLRDELLKSRDIDENERN